MTLNNYIKSVLSGVKTWALSTFANKRDFDELNSRMYYSEQVEKFFFKNTQISPMDSYGDYVNVSFLERQCDEISVGDTLNVVWDGTEYECKVFMYDGALMIGNKSIIGTMMGESFADTSEPFVIAIWDGYRVEFSYTDMVSESHVVSISGMVEKVHKIDEKYLPEMSAIGAEGTGDNAEIFNDYSHNVASGDYCHAEGHRTSALYNSSHAEGFNTTASGEYSHAEGSYTYATNVSSHSEGHSTTASGEYSHAEGKSTNALGYQSHAEGYGTTAEGDNSHAEGCRTSASGGNSHAECYRATASGDYSHAEGTSTNASGATSHAEGYYTTAASDYQHVQGKYNVTDDANLYAHIVGNGINDTSRSNAHTIDWDGNAWFAGDVYIGSTSGTNKDDGSTKLATEDFVQNSIKNADIDNKISVVEDLVSTKQDKLTFDDTPTDGSVNPVTSEGVKRYIDSSTPQSDWDQADDTDPSYIRNKPRITNKSIILTDEENGFDYVIKMVNGNLVTMLLKGISHLEIASMPEKTSYIEGEPIDLTGLYLNIVYEDGEKGHVTNYISDVDVVTANTTEINLTVERYGEIISVAIPITVSAFDPAIVLVDFDYTSNDNGTYTLTGWKGTLNEVTSTELVVPNNSLIIL